MFHFKRNKQFGLMRSFSAKILFSVGSIFSLCLMLSVSKAFADSSSSCPVNQAITSFSSDNRADNIVAPCTPIVTAFNGIVGIGASSGTCGGGSQFVAVPNGNQPNCNRCMSPTGSSYINLTCPAGQIATGVQSKTDTGCLTSGWIIECAPLINGWSMGGTGGITVLIGLTLTNNGPNYNNVYTGIYANINPPCDCSNFANSGCGNGCPADQMSQTRTCIPANCQTQLQCLGDSCTAFANAGCGAGGCLGNYMYQTRSCTYNCSATTQCLLDNPDCCICSSWVSDPVCSTGGCPLGTRLQTRSCPNACDVMTQCVADPAGCPYCGNGTCDANEDCSTCAQDCGACPVCGNGVCEKTGWSQFTETCKNCPGDCGPCPSCTATFVPGQGPANSPTSFSWNSTGDADNSLDYKCYNSSGTVIGQGTLPPVGGPTTFTPTESIVCDLNVLNLSGLTATCSAAYTINAGVCGTWGPGNPLYNAAVASWKLAKGSCLNTFTDPVVGGTSSVAAGDGNNYAAFWQPKLVQSGNESVNQQAKLQRRRNFLAARENEVKYLRDFFTSAMSHFTDIINAGEALRKERLRIEDLALVPLPNEAIYAWKTPATNPSKSSAKWHIVRVDGRIPGRCNGRCYQADNASLTIKEPKLAKIKTYTTMWGLMRCYSLGDAFHLYGGCDSSDDYSNARKCFLGATVKSQVIRWDEDKDTTIKLPTGLDVWRYKFRHPSVTSSIPSPNTLDVVCKDVISKEAPEAFMINRRTDSPACWDYVNAILEHGVMSRTCAEYFFHNGSGGSGPDRTQRGFSLKFVSCDYAPF